MYYLILRNETIMEAPDDILYIKKQGNGTNIVSSDLQHDYIYSKKSDYMYDKTYKCIIVESIPECTDISKEYEYVDGEFVKIQHTNNSEFVEGMMEGYQNG